MKANRLYLLLPVLALLGACGEERLTMPELDELGAVQKKYEVDYTEGYIDIQVYANKPGKAEFGGPVDWAAIQTPAFDGDAVLTVGYTENRGSEPREAMVLLSTATRRDTVYIIQSNKL